MESVARSDSLKYECLLFDIDGTLYPLSSGVDLACRKNIEEYMLHHLNIEEAEVPKMCLELYREYGTTMAGLKVGTSTLVAGADHALRSLHNIKEALPQIWEEEGQYPQQVIHSNAAELTVVQA